MSVRKSISAGLVSLGLAFGSAGLASGQDTAPDRGGRDAAPTNNEGTRTVAPRNNDDDRGFNWGLLGLLGLAGLIPLFTRRDHDTHRNHRHDTAASRGTVRT